MKTIYTIIVISLLLAFSGLKAQDANYTQFYNNPVYYNPANAGLEDGMAIRTSYRKLWPGVGGDFRNCMITVDLAEPAVSGGLGFMLHSGEEGGGNIRENVAGLMYSYRLPVIKRKFYLQMGLQAAAVHKKLNQDGLVFSDQLDPLYGDIYSTSYTPANNESVIYPDFATGITARFNLGEYNNGKARTTNVVGLSFAHITRPDESFMGLESKKPIKVVAHAHSIIPLTSEFRNSRRIALSPALIYENQNAFETFSAGLNFLIDPIYAGVWFRNRNVKLSGKNFDAALLVVGVKKELNRNLILNVGYSYDITISRLASATAGSHEVTVSLLFDDVQLFGQRRPSLRSRAAGARDCYHEF